jgi:plastocyanin domain-containing protein
VAALAAALVLTRGLRAPAADLLHAVEGTARPGADGVPEIALVARAGEWVPNVIHAVAGAPLRLRLSRAAAHGCDDAIVVPDLRLELEVPAGGEATHTLPPSRGSYLFTCRARMVKGVLLFE